MTTHAFMDLRRPFGLPIGLAQLSNAQASEPVEVISGQQSPILPFGNEWFRKSITSLYRISENGDNWDSYGGKPVSALSFKLAAELLEFLSDRRLPDVQVVPTSAGSVQLELSINLSDIELEIRTDGLIVAYLIAPSGEVSDAEFSTNDSAWRSRIAGFFSAVS